MRTKTILTAMLTVPLLLAACGPKTENRTQGPTSGLPGQEKQASASTLNKMMETSPPAAGNQAGGGAASSSSTTESSMPSYSAPGSNAAAGKPSDPNKAN
jgi:hypothetical protein